MKIFLWKRLRRGVRASTYSYRFKLHGKVWTHQTQHTNADHARQKASDHIKTLEAGVHDQVAHLFSQRTARNQLTVGAVLDDWLAAGCPTPNRKPRTAVQHATQLATLKHARPWWDARPVATITGPTLGDYAEARRATITTGDDGDRTIDLELTSLSNAFRWAVAKGLCEKNPFASRQRFKDPAAVTHCTAYMPASDEELHRITGLLLTSARPFYQVAGAQLLFQALTGLRSGEPAFLRLDAPPDTDQPGSHITKSRAGQPYTCLAVHRLKHGINPAVQIHPALRAFLDAWLPTVRQRWSESPWYFPNPNNPGQPLQRDRLRVSLQHAIRALRLPPRIPHGMRAFYVRVRRAQNETDSQIALELGESTGEPMIHAVYGQRSDIHGLGDYDWLPSSESGLPPAWLLLRAPANTVTPLHQATA